MTRTRMPAVAGFATLALIVATVAVWQLHPFAGRDAWVPTCSDLAPVMQSSAGGAWSVSEPDGARGKTQSSTLCQLAFSSADQRFSGTVHILVQGDTDEDAARQKAVDADCLGVATAATAPSGYSAYRTCGQNNGERVNGSVIAAKGDRWANLSASTSVPPGTEGVAAIAYAQDLAGKLAEHAMTLTGANRRQINKMERYFADVAAIRATGTSADRWVTVTRTSDGDLVGIRPGPLRLLTDREVAAEIRTALLAALADHRRQYVDLRISHFGSPVGATPFEPADTTPGQL
ncbi:hypothetical protein [Actinoplanes sp. NPDC049681]|uniref:hypothetical protein n=1 Tax=Actinoplanes sp. NPDC049681 TaxID=3363905 RepID=UPI0037ADD581